MLSLHKMNKWKYNELPTQCFGKGKRDTDIKGSLASALPCYARVQTGVGKNTVYDRCSLRPTLSSFLPFKKNWWPSYISQTDFEFMILLSQSPKSWGYRGTIAHLAFSLILLIPNIQEVTGFWKENEQWNHLHGGIRTEKIQGPS